MVVTPVACPDHFPNDDSVVLFEVETLFLSFSNVPTPDGGREADPTLLLDGRRPGRGGPVRTVGLLSQDHIGTTAVLPRTPEVPRGREGGREGSVRCFTHASS